MAIINWSLSIDRAIPKPFRTLLRGVGQVFFCCNAVTGLIFLVALYIGGVTAGLAATAGVLSSTIAAHLLGFPEKDIDAGLYGFNGTLVGPCLFLFLENSPQLWLYVVLASILSTIVLAALMRILQPYDIPASTAPFVLTSWLFMAAVFAFDSFSRGSLLPIAGIPVEAANISMIPAEIGYMAATKGISEVMFADSVIVGILFLIGIAIHSLWGAAMALSGTIVGIVIPVLLGVDKNLIEMGLYAFNPVLAMMAVGWAFLKPSGRSMGLAFLAGIFTVICQAGLTGFLTPLGLPALTLPFVLVMWVFLLAADKSKYQNYGGRNCEAIMDSKMLNENNKPET